MANTFLEMLKDLFYWVGNTTIEILASLITTMLGFFPEVHLPKVIIDFGEYPIVQCINWVFPVGIAITCINIYIICLVSYLTHGTILRWAKVIR